MQEVELLILGAGWTSTFLIPLLKAQGKTFAATSTSGREDTIEFKFDPSESDPSYFSVLPHARNILIVFPLVGKGQSELLVSSYKKTHRRSSHAHFIQLGSTGIWQIPKQELWVTRHSKYDDGNKRAVAEDELLGLGGCVLNLAGLWGGSRDARHLVARVGTSKEVVKSKTTLHMIHGEDVARAVSAVTENWEHGHAAGQRWMLTDQFVYDWWSLFAGWADYNPDSQAEERQPSEQSVWVYELMNETGVRALPREMQTLGRCYDSREFWKAFKVTPLKGRIL